VLTKIIVMAQRRKATKRKSALKSRAPKKKAASKRKSTKKSSAAKKKATPWERPAPAHAKHTHLTEADKTKAKQRARRAGRPYPNLVDNMNVAKKKGRKKTAKAKKS
jgi:hypothetical protein